MYDQDFWIDAERSLTAEEFRVLRLLAAGYTEREIRVMSTFSKGGIYRKKVCIIKKVAEMWGKTL